MHEAVTESTAGAAAATESIAEAARRGRYSRAATALALYSDRQLADLIAGAQSLGTGIGGHTFRIDVDGVPVFGKQVRLTDLERRPEHVMSTANVFELPTFYQYGVGSAGFGAWRELAAHIMTTAWELAGESRSFALMYHWRVLPGPEADQVTPETRTAIDETVAFWQGSDPVRTRIEALAGASASIVLFLEFVPQTVHAWLRDQIESDASAIDAACRLVDEGLAAGVQTMRAHEFVHFDAHFDNILCDGGRLYFVDFGLAASLRFDLSESERAFVTRHLDYDRAETETMLATSLVWALCDWPDKVNATGPRLGLGLHEYVRAVADGAPLGDGLPPVATTLIRRYAPVAALVNDLFRRLRDETKLTEYPAAELAAIWDAAPAD